MHDLKEIISHGHFENELMYPHKNPGMELVLIDQGNLEWAVEGVPEILKPGTIFFTLPWQAHGSMHIREPRNKVYFVLFELINADFQPLEKIGFADCFGFSEGEQEWMSEAFIAARRHAWPASDLIKQLFPELIQRLESKSPIDHSLSISILRTMLLELAHIVKTSSGAGAHLSATALKVERFLKELNHSLELEWSLDEMATICGIKRTYFSTITRQLTGYPPMQYLNRLRFEKACELLRDTKQPITEIGFSCGYATSQYFAETFRRYARMTPTEYRTNLQSYDAIMQTNWSHPEARSLEDEQKRKTSMGLN